MLQKQIIIINFYVKNNIPFELNRKKSFAWSTIYVDLFAAKNILFNFVINKIISISN